jgi:glycosyltransferase involved in cell wall biosynthesis
MCSDSESFGISVVEAMAAGLPVVVTKTCPWHEVETAGCGLWVAQESGEVAKAVSYILSHPAEAESMGAHGKALASANYGWDSIARKMAACYATATGSRSPVG